MVSFTSLPLYILGRSPGYPLDRILGGPQILSVLNGLTQLHCVSQYTSDVIVVPCFLNSAIISFLSQKTVVVDYLADKVCLNFSDLFDECVYIHCFDCSLVSTFTNEIQVSSLATRTI
jgi:hypothetical protein